jgi:hypothetical protein
MPDTPNSAAQIERAKQLRSLINSLKSGEKPPEGQRPKSLKERIAEAAAAQNEAKPGK